MPITPMKPVPAATRPRTGATASRTAAPAPVVGTPAADPAGHVLAWLGRHQGFDALTARAEVLLALQADLDCLDTSATGGARRLTALGLQDDVLVLSAPGAALAAKLRQIEDFQQRAQPFVEVVKQAQSKSVGTVAEAGLESAGANEAQVLVAVTVKTSNAGAPEQEPRAWRMRISVEKIGDDAKVSNVEFVP